MSMNQTENGLESVFVILKSALVQIALENPVEYINMGGDTDIESLLSFKEG